MRCPICDTIHEADDLCAECRDEVAYTLAGFSFAMPEEDGATKFWRQMDAWKAMREGE